MNQPRHHVWGLLFPLKNLNTSPDGGEEMTGDDCPVARLTNLKSKDARADTSSCLLRSSTKTET